jgi:serine/threonine protein kinase
MVSKQADETQDSGQWPTALALPEEGSLVGDRYRVTGVIGSGGMGAVFAAENISVGRRCAIKFLRTELASRSRLASRFEREARLLGRLEHDHVTAVTDYGYYREHSPFFVMEYLEGETLRAVLRRDGCMSLQPAVELIRQVCRGMAYAHEQGVVHRDLKPENLMLTRRSDGQVWVKILDFGVAHWSTAAEARLTPTGAELGTAHYMSPEQARGAKDVEPSSDVYAIGVILYEILSGQRVHPGQFYNEVLFHVLTQEHRPLRELVPSCPQAVSDLVDRCLNKDAAQRYRDGEELLAALTELSLPEAPAASSTLRRGRGPSRVWRAAALGLLAGTALGMGGALGVWAPGVSAPPQPAAPAPAETVSLSELPVTPPSTPSEEVSSPVPPRAAKTPSTKKRSRRAPSSAAASERAPRAAPMSPEGEGVVAAPAPKFPFVTANPYAQEP